MKKTISVLLILITLLCAASGCVGNTAKKDIGEDNKDNNNNENIQNSEKVFDYSGEYHSAIIDYSDASSLGSVKIEYEIRDYEGFKDKKGPEKVTFKDTVFNEGKEITISMSDKKGEFVRNNYYPVYRYGDIAWFNPNGDLERYRWGRPVLSEVKRKCSEEEAIRVASEFVSEITDPDLYTVSVVDSEAWNRYVVYFTKYVDGIKTTEELEVTVNYHGELHSYVADMFNQFPADTKNPYDMDRVTAVARERVNSIYGKYEQYYDIVEYSDEEFRLTRLKDGSLAIWYTVGVDFYTDHGDGFIEGEEASLIEMLIMP